MIKILDYMKENLLYLDGGMGTLLQEKDLAPGEHPEMWNLTHPDEVADIHRQYFDAGSNVVNTNTFGANSLKFPLAQLEQILQASIENAKKGRDLSSAPHPKYVALDIGPCGKLLKPYGDLAFEDAVELFAQIVRAGTKHGVDLIFIETMSDSYETKAALLAAKENSDLPVFVSNAYGEDGKLMTGATPSAMVALLEGMGADAIGANCSLEPKQLVGVVDELLTCSSLPIILKPNAGLPEESPDGKAVYGTKPDEFASDIASAVKKGVRIIGGCCGTDPEYIEKIKRATDGLAPLPVTPKNITCLSSYTHMVSFGQAPVLIGERINPTGKKLFKEALRKGDMDYILQEGVNQQDLGVHVLDVNVGLPEIDEVQMLADAVFQLQSIINLPLQIDTSDTAAMEKALRLYNGKAMINSVSGKAESMEAIFPLVKKYGGLVVALTLDDDGIPDTAQGRVSIAKKILAKAKEYGLSEKDLVFDTLAMTVSADPKAAKETLSALHTIRHELGCHTSLGVSNISFGLPHRDAINSTFFACALEQGLSTAIMNPYSKEMMKTYYSYRALHNMDENCGEYIEFASSLGDQPVSVAPTTATASSIANSDGSQTLLQKAIAKGLKDQAGQLTKELLGTCQPLDIIASEIIPALDQVGEGFEEKRIFLPQLLMSAEAAKMAFEEIRQFMSSSSGPSIDKFPVVIATVKGDIHDIGKNIVKLLLENYGFNVVDLGKDVEPQTIVDAVISNHAPLAGLSALMTTTVPAMRETIALLREKAPWCKIMVGGAVLTEEYSQRIGADKYAKDAMDSVRFCESQEK